MAVLDHLHGNQKQRERFAWHFMNDFACEIANARYGRGEATAGCSSEGAAASSDTPEESKRSAEGMSGWPGWMLCDTPAGAAKPRHRRFCPSHPYLCRDFAGLHSDSTNASRDLHISIDRKSACGYKAYSRTTVGVVSHLPRSIRFATRASGSDSHPFSPCESSFMSHSLTSRSRFLR